MCIAIVNKKSMLPESVFENSFDSNPDGCGMAWIENSELKTVHSLKCWKSLYETYQAVRPITEHPILIHFRIGTSGIKDERNLHPFLVNQDIALIHNGMLSYNVMQADKSDTWHFVEFLKTLSNPLSLLDNSSIEFNTLSSFATGSKICFLHKSGNFQILNEKSGFWIGDTWYSNKSFEACQYSYFPQNTSAYDLASWDDLADSDLGFIPSDLKDWPANILSEDIVLNNYFSSRAFDAMDYSNKAMLVLSLGCALYSINEKQSAHKAITELMDVCEVININELFEELVSQSYALYEAVI